MRAKPTNTSPVTRSRRFLAGTASLAVLAVAACGATDGDGDVEAAAAGDGDSCNLAPDYPSGPISYIVPFAAGGGSDIAARLVANGLAERLDTQVNVVNRTGGGGIVGMQQLLDSAPDGRTIGHVSMEIGLYHWLGQSDMRVDDFTMVSQINSDPAGLTVSADSPYESVEDLLAAAEADPGSLVASGTAVNGSWHIALIGLLLEAGLDADAIRWVPSDGAAPALQELVAGGIDLSASSLAENATMIDSGHVRAIGVLAEERLEAFPDVPVVGEAGVAFDAGSFRGVGGPTGMDEDVVAELECYVKDITESEDFIEGMGASGLGVVYRNSEDFTEYMWEQDEAIGARVEAAGLSG